MEHHPKKGFHIGGKEQWVSFLGKGIDKAWRAHKLLLLSDKIFIKTAIL